MALCVEGKNEAEASQPRPTQMSPHTAYLGDKVARREIVRDRHANAQHTRVVVLFEELLDHALGRRVERAEKVGSVVLGETL